MYQGTGELKNFQSSKSCTHELKYFQSSESSSHVTNQSMFKYNQGTSQMSIIAVCIYRYVITFGLRSKYDVLGHYFIFMIVLPSINKFNMT